MTSPLTRSVVATHATDEGVDGHILGLFPDLVTELGGDPSLLLGKVGIDPLSFVDGRGNATYRQMVEVVARAAVDLACPDFGMRLAKAQAGTIRSPLFQVIENSPTLGDALQLVSTHSYAHSLAAAIWVRRSGETVMIGHDILLEGLPDRAQAMEQILLIAYLSIREITGGMVRARRVEFRHEPVSSMRVYRRFFGCEVKFGRNVDAIVFNRRDLDCPIAQSNDEAFQVALAAINAQFSRRTPPLHAKVRGGVMHLLGSENCTNEHVARILNLSVRSMHRRLQDENTTFRRIKNEVRRDLVLYFLQQTRLDMTIISERLGFSEQSTLTHFCRKWLGVSPSQLRRPLRIEAAKA